MAGFRVGLDAAVQLLGFVLFAQEPVRSYGDDGCPPTGHLVPDAEPLNGGRWQQRGVVARRDGSRGVLHELLRVTERVARLSAPRGLCVARIADATAGRHESQKGFLEDVLAIHLRGNKRNCVNAGRSERGAAQKRQANSERRRRDAISRHLRTCIVNASGSDLLPSDVNSSEGQSSYSQT